MKRLTILFLFLLALIPLAGAQAGPLTVNVSQRLGAGTVPDGTAVKVFNNDGSNLPGTPKENTASGTAYFPSVSLPTNGNTGYEVVVCLPSGAHGVQASTHNVAPGSSITVYLSAVEPYVSQATTSAPPVAFAVCTILSNKENTGVNGYGAPVWLPDGSYSEAFSMAPGVPGSQSFVLGSSCSSNLAGEAGYVRLSAGLTRIDLTARTSSGATFIPRSGNWAIFPEAFDLAINGEPISPAFWMPNGCFIGYLTGAAQAGAIIFKLGSTPISSPTLNIPVSATNGWLIGQVTDLNNVALSGFNVAAELSGANVATTTTNTKGYYVLEAPAKDYTVEFWDTAGNYIPTYSPQNMPAGTVETLDMQMAPYSAFIGNVVDQFNNPMANFTINFIQNGNTVASVNTDSNGNYREQLAAGTYSIAYFDGAVTDNVGNFDLAVGQVETVNLGIPTKGTVNGQVEVYGYEPSLQPVSPLPFATVQFIRNGFVVNQTITDGNGNYSIALPVGSYQVTFPEALYRTFQTFSTTVAYGGTTSVSVTMFQDPGNMSIHVEDPTGLPVFGAATYLFFGTGLPEYSVGSTDAYGNNTAINQYPGYYYVEVLAENNTLLQTTPSATELVTTNNTTSYTITLPFIAHTGTVLVGHVLSPSHPTGVSGASVSAFLFPFGPTYNISTDASGVYRILIPVGGTYELTFSDGTGFYSGFFSVGGNYQRIDYSLPQ